MVGIKDIARLCGVSTATVSLALNGSPLVSDITREKVVAAAKNLGYRPNPYARTLVTKRSMMLGLIVPDIRNVYYATLVHHINHAVRASGYGMSIAMSENNPDYEEKIVSEMVASRVDGLMLSPLNTVGHSRDYLAELPMPTIFTASRYGDLSYPTVMTDYRASMADLTRLALKKGRSRLLFVTGPKGEFSLDERLEGYLSVTDSPESVLHCEAVSYKCGADAASMLVETGKIRELDCILCVNDTMAAGVENILMRGGIRVPDEVALAGYDDILFAETSAVPLTTVRQDIPALAEATVSALLKMIEGKETPALTTIPAELTLRDSL